MGVFQALSEDHPSTRGCLKACLPAQTRPNKPHTRPKWRDGGSLAKTMPSGYPVKILRIKRPPCVIWVFQEKSCFLSSMTHAGIKFQDVFISGCHFMQASPECGINSPIHQKIHVMYKGNIIHSVREVCREAHRSTFRISTPLSLFLCISMSFSSPRKVIIWHFDPLQ